MEKFSCRKCSELNRVENNYCHNCGKKLLVKELKVGSFASIMNFIGSMILKLLQGILNNLYLILLVISIGYFVLFSFLKFNTNFLENWENKTFWLDFYKDIALLIFSAGIFTASLKYLQYIKVFEQEFERILLSKKFNDKIKNSVESITFSESFLLQQSNLDDIWERVTLSKYKKQFPNLYPNLKKSISNDFFQKSNISYYYKNLKKVYNVKKVSTFIICIEEDTTYTIVRPTNDEFNWDFRISMPEKNSKQGKYPLIELKIQEGCGTEFDSDKHITCKSENGVLTKKADIELSGFEEYFIQRKVIVHQDLRNDREWNFGSDRIIDHLDVSIQYSTDLQVIFSNSHKTKFIEEITGDNNKISYINRTLMLPGEKFKLFFLKT